VAISYEHGYESSGFLDWLSDCQLLKKDPVPCSDSVDYLFIYLARQVNVIPPLVLQTYHKFLNSCNSISLLWKLQCSKMK
jgi:hypothetical protein